MDVPAALRLAQRLRRSSTAAPATSASARPTSTCRPPPVPPGHHGARDELGDRQRLDHRARRPADRPVAPRRRPVEHASPRRPPTTTPTTCCCAWSAASTARCDLLMTASPSSTTAGSPRAVGVRGRGLPARASPRPRASDLTLRLTTDLRLGFEGRGRPRAPDAQGATCRFVALSWSEHAAAPHFDEAYDRLVWTAHHWQNWLAPGNFPDHPWRSYLERSALTLKGLTYAPTGALIAAATTSLPETPGGERNWDYRYSWIRDSTFTLWGLYTLGLRLGSERLLLLHRRRRAGDGRPPDHVRGRRREASSPRRSSTTSTATRVPSPVRIGNGAYDQRQHDVWGAVLDSFYLHTKSRDGMPEEIWPILKQQVERGPRALARDRTTASGRCAGEPQHFTSSKVMCWVALDRGARLARLREDHELADEWQVVADEIHADICENAVDDRGVFTQHYDTDALDASLPAAAAAPLPAARRSADPGDRPGDRRRTHRRRPRAPLPGRRDRRRPRAARKEASPSARSGWSVPWSRSASWTGPASSASGCSATPVRSSSTPRRSTPFSGRHLGNFPQAFTHLALINAVMHVIRAEERDGGHAFTPAHSGPA